jgi:hypothetical protein
MTQRNFESDFPQIQINTITLISRWLIPDVLSIKLLKVYFDCVWPYAVKYIQPYR